MQREPCPKEGEAASDTLGQFRATGGAFGRSRSWAAEALETARPRPKLRQAVVSRATTARGR
eukprot:15231434-Alexandrium_andersonii.AAC.1